MLEKEAVEEAGSREDLPKKRPRYDDNFTQVQVSKAVWRRLKVQAYVADVPLYRVINSYLLEGLKNDESLTRFHKRRREYLEKEKGLEG